MVDNGPGPLVPLSEALYPQPTKDGAMVAAANGLLAGYEQGTVAVGQGNVALAGAIGDAHSWGAGMEQPAADAAPYWQGLDVEYWLNAISDIYNAPDPFNQAVPYYPPHPSLTPTPPPVNEFFQDMSQAVASIVNESIYFLNQWVLNIPPEVPLG